MKKRSFRVNIVLPNWNGAYLLRKHLPYVLAAAPEAEVIVADDASTDESVELLRTKFPQVKIVANQVRQGFAGNVNSGVAAAGGDVVILLNTDVRPPKGFLAPLLKHFKDPEVFAVGCLEESYDKEGITLRGRGQARWEKGFFIHSRGEVDKTDTAWVSGGSGAFRKRMWDQLDGMDFLYNPFYWEDIDLSYRALKAGWRLVFEPKSRVGHFHEEGKIRRTFNTTQVKRIVYRNQFIFIWKNISDPALILAHALFTPLRLIQSLLRGDLLMLMGYLAAVVRLPLILKARFQAAKLWQRGDREIFPA